MIATKSKTKPSPSRAAASAAPHRSGVHADAQTPVPPAARHLVDIPGFQGGVARILEHFGLRTVEDLERLADAKHQGNVFHAIRAVPGVGEVQARAAHSAIGPRRPSLARAAANGHADAPPAAPPPAADPDEMVRINLKAIEPCPLNPRKHFDEGKLQELAVSIRAKGVLQPILVRPHPRQGAGPERFQVVAGERRFRAAGLAGCLVIPAIVRTLSDREVLEIAVVENEQREDVTPLEKAEGYGALVDQHGVTVEDLAKKIGKSISTIRGLLKLRQLPEKAREALAAGKLERSVAELIARVPGEKVREEVTKVALTPDRWRDDGEMPSYRQVKATIQQRYMIELKQAPFATKDADLVPSAGSCTACPKRTGNNRDEYPDGRADVCTDPTCYHEKVKAWQAQAVAVAESTGLTVLTAKESKPLFGHGSLLYSAPYLDLASTCYDDKKSRTYGQILDGPELGAKVVLAYDDRGGLHKLMPKAAAQAALKAKGIGPGRASSAGDARYKAEEAKRRREQEQAKEVARRCMGQVAAKVEDLARSVLSPAALEAGPQAELLRIVATGTVHHIWDDVSREAVKRRGLKSKGHSGGNRDILEKEVAGYTGRQALALTVELIAGKALLGFGSQSKETTTLLEVFGVDRTAVAKSVKQEHADKAKPKGKPAAAPEMDSCARCTGIEVLNAARLCKECAKKEAPYEAAKKQLGTGELLRDLGLSQADLEAAGVSIAGKFCGGRPPKKPIGVRPIHINGRMYVESGGSSHGEYRSWHVHPLYTVADYRAKFGSQPTKLAPLAPDLSASRAVQDEQRREYYTGVLVSIRGETYAIGPGAEERLLHNGKPRPGETPTKKGKADKTPAAAEPPAGKLLIDRTTMLADLVAEEDVAEALEEWAGQLEPTVGRLLERMSVPKGGSRTSAAYAYLRNIPGLSAKAAHEIGDALVDAGLLGGD